MNFGYQIDETLSVSQNVGGLHHDVSYFPENFSSIVLSKGKGEQTNCAISVCQPFNSALAYQNQAHNRKRKTNCNVFPWNYDVMSDQILESCLAFKRLRSTATKCSSVTSTGHDQCVNKSAFGNFLATFDCNDNDRLLNDACDEDNTNCSNKFEESKEARSYDQKERNQVTLVCINAHHNKCLSSL